MYIPRSIIILILMMFVFSPAIDNWISTNQAAWYRPYIAWGIILFIIYRSQKSSQSVHQSVYSID